MVTLVAMWSVALGVGCDLLCYNLDSHYFDYFGGADSPALFLGNGVTMAALGGLLVGLLCFTDPGRAMMDPLGGER
ncbi:MAG: hypothetical protein H6741_27640 [Alphaproteobacteria bacterium]|nr:hypothetical protein [Alphaproteobacteria bacterium]